MSREEAEAAIAELFAVRGAEAVIEEFLDGEEASLFVLTDGDAILPFGSAQDHKRVGDGDTGPNTGGMGAYSPARVLTPELERQAIEEIILPTVAAMKAAGMPFSGVLYAGLMLTAQGLKLIEYNARFGDPECQVLMMRLDEDLLELLLAVAEGRLGDRGPRALLGRYGVDRGDGGQWLSGHARGGRHDHRDRGGRSDRRPCLPGRHAPRRRGAGRGWRTCTRGHRHRPRRGGRAGYRLCRSRPDRLPHRLLP